MHLRHGWRHSEIKLEGTGKVMVPARQAWKVFGYVACRVVVAPEGRLPIVFFTTLFALRHGIRARVVGAGVVEHG